MPDGQRHRPRGRRAGGVRRVPRHLQGAQHAAHAAHVGHERDPRDRPARRSGAHRRGRRRADQGPARHRDRVRDDQHRRRVPRHRPHAGDVQRSQAPGGRGRLMDSDVINLLYIVAFSLFITGLAQLTSPTTAVRGNRTAAVGMAVAVIATLLREDTGNWGLIALGIVIGTAIGVPAARNVKMTAMPQMVALFNGVGGGAIALIAWAEFRERGGDLTDLEVGIPLVFAAIVGSISFWGSNIAFGKLQELISGRPLKLPGGVFINGALLLIAIAAGVVMLAGSDNELVFIVLLVAAGALGVLAVLPIGGADMPVVISTLNAFTGLSAAAAGVALDNTALIVAGMLVGASGTILTDQMAKAMNRSIASVLLGGFGGATAAIAGPDGAEDGRIVRSTSAADAAIQLAYARKVVVVPGYGMAVAQAQHAVREMAKALESRGVEVTY